MAFHDKPLSSSLLQTLHQARALFCISTHAAYFQTELCVVSKWEQDCRENEQSLCSCLSSVHRLPELRQKSQSVRDRASTVLEEAKRKVIVLLLAGPRVKCVCEVENNIIIADQLSIFLHQNYNALVTCFKINYIQLHSIYNFQGKYSRGTVSNNFVSVICFLEIVLYKYQQFGNYIIQNFCQENILCLTVKKLVFCLIIPKDC